MNKILSAIIAVSLFNLGIATASETTLKVNKGEIPTVTLASKGADVRNVLHDLFTQVQCDYVIENVGRTELYLSLKDTDFDETLEVLCRLAKLEYEIQNGIYYFRHAKTAGRSTTPPTQLPTESPSKQPSGTPASLTVPPTPTGVLARSVLTKPVTGSWNKADFRSLIADLGKQSGVTLEVSDKIPTLYLDLTLGKTSLGWTLNTLAARLKLKIVFTDRKSIRLEPR